MRDVNGIRPEKEDPALLLTRHTSWRGVNRLSRPSMLRDQPEESNMTDMDSSLQSHHSQPRRYKGMKRRWLAFCICGIRSKLVAALLAMGIAVVIATGVFSYQAAHSALLQGVKQSLTAVTFSKQQQVNQFFKNTQNTVLLTAARTEIIKGCRALTDAFAKLQTSTRQDPALVRAAKESLLAYYQSIFLPVVQAVEPTHFSCTPEQIVPVNDSAAMVVQQVYLLRQYVPEKEIQFDYEDYDKAFQEVNGVLSNLQDVYGFEDILIVNRDGQVLYSFEKRIDLGINIKNGPFLACGQVAHPQPIQLAFEGAQSNDVYIEDYAPYLPAYLKPQAFFSTKIFDKGEEIGVLIASTPISKINDMMTSDNVQHVANLGKTAEAYLVGSDYKMRSDTRVDWKNEESRSNYLKILAKNNVTGLDKISTYNTSILFQELKPSETNFVFSKPITEVGDYYGYRGDKVIGGGARLSIANLTWAVVTKQDLDEAFLDIYTLSDHIMVVGFLTSGLLTFAAIVLSTWVSLPLYQIKEGMDYFANGFLEHRIFLKSKDELQQLAEATNRMAAELQQRIVSKSYVDNILSSISEAMIVASPYPKDPSDLSRSYIGKLNSSARRLLKMHEREILSTEIPLSTVFPELPSLSLERLNNIDTFAASSDGERIPILLSMSHIVDRDEVVCVARDMREIISLEEKQRFVREAFGRYVTEDVMQQVLDNPEGLKLGGELRQVTILMSHIKNFNAATGKLNPVNVVQFLNRYLESMVNIILEHKGVVDEIIGDGILVIFGAPVTREDDALRAIRCAIHMQNAMKAINEAGAQEDFPPLEMGIGIHCGEAVAGNIGSVRRMKYGVVGNTVNLTGRIESSTTGNQILISEACLLEAGGPDMVLTRGCFSIEPKGGKGTMVIMDVKGVATGTDELLLAGAQDDEELSDPIRITFSVVLLGREQSYEGEIRKVSNRGAVLYSEQYVAPMSHVRVHDFKHSGKEEVHGKVIQHTDAVEKGLFYLRFDTLVDKAQFL